MDREVDKFKAIAYIVRYLRLSSCGEYYDVFGYSDHLLDIFGSGDDIIKFIDTNSFFFSFYGIESSVALGITFYRGKMIYY